MNDVVLHVDMRKLAPPIQGGRFHALTLPFVLQLGREQFAERPLLHREEPERARRLAALILCKASDVQAALFQAPEAGCKPDEVTCRLAQVAAEVLVDLRNQQSRDALTPVTVDREIWRRMAA